MIGINSIKRIAYLAIGIFEKGIAMLCFWGRILYLKIFFVFSVKRKPDPKVIVFISNYPRVRVAKIAHGLRACGWKVILIYEREPIFDVDKYFDEKYQYLDVFAAALKAYSCNSAAVHIFMCDNFDAGEIFLRTYPGKVIIDIYDNYAGMLKVGTGVEGYKMRQKMAQEKFCLEKAEGLCCRNLETQVAKRLLGYKINALRIFFPEYSWGDTEWLPKLSDSDNSLHVVYGGSVWSEKLFGRDVDFGFIWFAEMLAKYKVHFHLYPGHALIRDDFEAAFSEYIDLDKRSDYFHLHMPISPENWMQELSKYDVGVCIYKSLLEGREPKQYTADQPRMMYSNGAVADFIDAGLHLIANKDILVTNLMRHVNVCTPVQMEDLNRGDFWQELSLKVKEDKKRYENARRDWSINKNTPRLIRFYNKVEEGR